MPRKKGSATTTKEENLSVTRIAKGLLDGVDVFLKTERAKALGLDSKSDVISYAVRELLKKEGML